MGRVCATLAALLTAGPTPGAGAEPDLDSLVPHPLSKPRPPDVIEGPPAEITGPLGRTLRMEVTLREPPGEGGGVRVQWSLGGLPVCAGSVCLLPLDGRTANLGDFDLTILYQNPAGNTRTVHRLHVVQGDWDPKQPFPSGPVLPVSLVPQRPAGDDPRELKVWTTQDRGGTWVQGGQTVPFGEFPVRGPFAGSIESAPGPKGALRLAQEGLFESGAMPGTLIVLVPEGEGKNLYLQRGTMRVRSTQATGSDPLFAASTPEVRVIPSPGANFFLTRSQPPQPPTTRLVVVQGQVQAVYLETPQAGKKPVVSTAMVSPGREFFLSSGGTVSPNNAPNLRELAQWTADLGPLAPPPGSPGPAARRQLAQAQLKATVRELDTLLLRQEWFEAEGVLNHLGLGAVRSHAELAYRMGVVKKRLYEIDEAAKWFRAAIQLNPALHQPYWELAQLNLEEKQWAKAETYLAQAKGRLPPGDPLAQQVDYYEGVAEFNLGQWFSAQSSFTRALWASGLDQSLKASAESFLGALSRQKPWSLVAPVGIQYDGNPTSLPDGDALDTSVYPQKTLWRTLAGSVVSYAASAQATRPGLYWGASAKLISLVNYPRGYKLLDILLGQIDLSQTLLFPGPDAQTPLAPLAWKWTQSLGFTRVANKPYLVTPSVQLDAGSLQIYLAYNKDLSTSGGFAADNVECKQSYSFDLGSLGAAANPGAVTLEVVLDEKIAKNKTDFSGNSLELTLTPSYAKAHTPRLSSRTSLALDVNSVWSSTTTTTVKTTLTPGLSYFLTPQILVILQGSYEFDLTRPSGKSVNRPGASLLFTGLL